MMYRFTRKIQSLILLLLYNPVLPMSLKYRPMKSISNNQLNHQSNILREGPESNEALRYYKKSRHRYKPICNPDMYPGVDCQVPTTCVPVYQHGVRAKSCNTVRPRYLSGSTPEEAEPFVIVQLSGGTTSTMAPYVGNKAPHEAHHNIGACGTLAKCEEHTWKH